MQFKRRNHFKNTTAFQKYSDKVEAVCTDPTAQLTKGKVYEIEILSETKIRCINNLATVCTFKKDRFEVV